MENSLTFVQEAELEAMEAMLARQARRMWRRCWLPSEVICYTAAHVSTDGATLLAEVVAAGANAERHGWLTRHAAHQGWTTQQTIALGFDLVSALNNATDRRERSGRQVADRRRGTPSSLAMDRTCLHNASMPNVLIRDLPDDIHRELERRARSAGQSLQQFLTGYLAQLVARPTVDDVLASLASQSGGRVGLGQAVDDLRAERSDP